MLSGLSILFVTVFTFQNQTANGFRPPDKPAVIDPAKPISAEARGDILMARKMYREAIESYREGPKDSPVVANKIGIAYHQLIELDLAKKEYERAIKLSPRYAEAINNLGAVYYSHKSYRRAVKEYKKALRIQPNSASFLSNLGTAYYARKQYKQAFAIYEQALKIDPEVFERRSSVGTTLQERTVEERARFHYLIAKTYAKAGDNDRALLYIRKSLEEGFKDRQKFKTDPEFAALKENPEFKRLMTMEIKVL